MKDTKRRFEWFSFYDHTGIEKHMERMAEEGWLLEKIGSFTWHYRRTEPKKLTFSVSFFPKASVFDPGPSEEQETFRDFCAHTGWTLAASSAQMQVFYNERPDPVPIDTDPALEVEAIHKAAKKSFLISQFMLLAVGMLNFGQSLWRLFDDTVATLSSSLFLFSLMCWPVLFVLIGTDLGTYFLWRRRAVKAAEQGEFLATRSHPMLQKLALAVVLTLALVLKTNVLRTQEPGRLPLTLADLVEISADGKLNQNVRLNRSPLLAVLDVNQHFWAGSGAGDPPPHWLEYTVTQVKIPVLYGVCRDGLLHQYDLHDRHFSPIDAAPWGAQEAYRSAYEDSGPMNNFLLCYPDRIVEIYFDLTPTPAQMAVVGEKLGGQ